MQPDDGTVYGEHYLVNSASIKLNWDTIKDAEAYQLVIVNTNTNREVMDIIVPAMANRSTNGYTLDLTKLGLGRFNWTLRARQYVPTGQWVPVNNAIPETMPAMENVPQDLPEFKGDGRYKTTSNKLTVSLWARESGSPQTLDVGEWLFRAENPGAFTADIPLTIKFMKWYDVSLSAGYSPLFVLYDDNVKSFFGTNFMPLGADIRGTFIFLKRRAGYFGMSLNAKRNTITGKFDAHTVSALTSCNGPHP